MLELGHGFRVVDVHTRLDPEEGRQVGRGREVEPERLERELHQAGIVRAVAIPGERECGYLAANNAVARLCIDRSLVPFARIDGSRNPTSRLRSLVASREEWHVTPEEVHEFALDDRFHGFALDPVRDGLPDEAVLDALEDAGLPLLLHVDRRFRPRAAATHLLGRGFAVICCSFDGHPLDRRLMHAAVELLPEYDNCYLETTTVRYRDALERALAEHPDRVLFGSGAPTVHPGVGVMELLTCSVPEDVIKRAFDGNASRVIPELAP